MVRLSPPLLAAAGAVGAAHVGLGLCVALSLAKAGHLCQALGGPHGLRMPDFQLEVGLGGKQTPLIIAV